MDIGRETEEEKLAIFREELQEEMDSWARSAEEHRAEDEAQAGDGTEYQ